MRQKNVLHVFKKMDRGGAELRTIDLLKNIDQDRYKFYFCSLSGEKGELDETINNLGGQMVYCNLKDVLFAKKFINIIKKYNINVVHSNTYYFSGIILLLANIAKVPIRIAHFRSFNSGKNKNLYNKTKSYFLKTLIKKYATNIIGVSKAALIGSFDEHILNDTRVSLLYNGLDISVLQSTIDNKVNHKNLLINKYNLKKDCKIIIHIGRFTDAKNHSFLIDIFNKYLRKNNNAVLFLIGKEDNEIQTDILKKLSDYNIESKVFFLGVQSNIYEFLLQADLMLYPSIREGLPGAVLESMVSGVPVIASDIAPHKELESYFEKTITIVGLNEPPEVWAEIINRKLNLNNSPKNIETFITDFLKTPFSIKNYVENYQRLIK
ncbi:glycosyltransferase [Oceanobacillus profundus]|uniref:glycosyltransferase n=1 Tax=Oceanobacillus profundus TaxID=372463 RepID=UPI0026E339D9|nr:glycosyltransferase [Oceanobacillus profundus]MDO6450502.1 glycosyltransferase [Oceanobacillus profundus]